MTLLARHHRLVGWGLAAGWIGAALLLLLSMPIMESVGEHGVFLRWAPAGLPLALATWVWAFGEGWAKPGALLVLALALGSWAALAAVGGDGRVHLAARDAYFLRQHLLAFALRGVLWLYLIHPLAIMTAGCLAVVEYLRHPAPWLTKHPRTAP